MNEVRARVNAAVSEMRKRGLCARAVETAGEEKWGIISDRTYLLMLVDQVVYACGCAFRFASLDAHLTELSFPHP